MSANINSSTNRNKLQYQLIKTEVVLELRGYGILAIPTN